MITIQALNPEIVRRYRDEIAQFYFENLRECYLLENFSYEESNKKISEFITHLENDRAIGYGLFSEEEICGFVWAYPYQYRGENRMYINEIRIRDDCRGKGYGKELLACVEKQAKEMGFGTVFLHAEADNPTALNLYQSCGFVKERIQFRKDIP